MNAPEFNAARARTKRPCPIWLDAFLRDTQDLEADEIGAYFLIIAAMWSRESCDFPNDERKLARVSRVSLRLWRSRIGPAVLRLMSLDGDVWIQRRLRKEAAYTERQVTLQHSRRAGKKPAKTLENKEPGGTADKPRNNRGGIQPNYPITQHTLPKGSDAGASDPAKIVFDTGLALLTAAGMSERQTRSLIGKWRKASDDARLADLIQQAEGMADPAAYVTAALQKRPSREDARNQDLEEAWL